LSRSQIKARGAVIRVNGAIAKVSRPLNEGDELEVLWVDEGPSTIEAEDLSLDIPAPATARAPSRTPSSASSAAPAPPARPAKRPSPRRFGQG
jgi:hypothetical protein